MRSRASRNGTEETLVRIKRLTSSGIASQAITSLRLSTEAGAFRET
jgi:hypothetical protein